MESLTTPQAGGSHGNGGHGQRYKGKQSVFLVTVPVNWRPQNAWDWPPTFTAGKLHSRNLAMVDAHHFAKVYNRRQVELSQRCEWDHTWAVVCKHLRSRRHGRHPDDRFEPVLETVTIFSVVCHAPDKPPRVMRRLLERKDAEIMTATFNSLNSGTDLPATIEEVTVQVSGVGTVLSAVVEPEGDGLTGTATPEQRVDSPRQAEVDRLTTLAEGALWFEFSPVMSLAGDPNTRGHLFAGGARDEADTLVLDDRLPVPLDQQVVSELWRVSKFFGDLADQVSARLAEGGAAL